VAAHNETDFRYEGWRVASAASVGVFVSFASRCSCLATRRSNHLRHSLHKNR